MNTYSVAIKSAPDLVKARLGLRNFMLNDLKSNPFVIVRVVIAMTAMGELILSSHQNEPVEIECSLVKDQGSTFLRFYCQFVKAYQDNEQTQRSKANFAKVMEESDFSNALEVSGLLLLKAGF